MAGELAVLRELYNPINTILSEGIKITDKITCLKMGLNKKL